MDARHALKGHTVKHSRAEQTRIIVWEQDARPIVWNKSAEKLKRGFSHWFWEESKHTAIFGDDVRISFKNLYNFIELYDCLVVFIVTK